MFDLGGGELLMILVAVLVLFGPKKLPELAQGLGKGLRSFRRAQQEFNDQVNSVMREDERKKNDVWSRPIEPKTVPRVPNNPGASPEDPAAGTIADLDKLADQQDAATSTEEPGDIAAKADDATARPSPFPDNEASNTDAHPSSPTT